VLAAAAPLALGLTAVAQPASAAGFTQQCDLAGDCLNFYNGGFAVRTWDGRAANNNIAIQWLAAGGFELRDNVHGGCVGDLGGSQSAAQLGGGQDCPSSGHAAWGTIFTVYAQCSGGTSLYQNKHWAALGTNGLVGFAAGSNHPVYANTSGGICLKQSS
jgi:hypothetical protein